MPDPRGSPAAAAAAAAAPAATPSTQSARSVADGQALMGVATTRPLERVAAALGEIEAAPLRFQPADDLPHGGVLCALPALLALGLLRHTAHHFSWPAGYYSMESIFLLLAYLVLARVPSLRHPDLWGKTMISKL